MTVGARENLVKAHTTLFKNPEEVLIEKNRYSSESTEALKSNWYALAISIVTKHDISAALRLMGIHPKRKSRRKEEEHGKQN